MESTPTGGVRRNHKDYSDDSGLVGLPHQDEGATGRPSRRAWSRTSSGWIGPRPLRTYRRAREDGKYVAFSAACGYDLLQAYVRSEQLLVSMIEDPGFVKEMVDVTSRLIWETAVMMQREGFHFDGAWVYNDMGYRNSSLFSPELYSAVIGPADTERNRIFHEAGHADDPALLRLREGPDPEHHRLRLRLPPASGGEGGHGSHGAQASPRRPDSLLRRDQHPAHGARGRRGDRAGNRDKARGGQEGRRVPVPLRPLHPHGREPLRKNRFVLDCVRKYGAY